MLFFLNSDPERVKKPTISSMKSKSVYDKVILYIYIHLFHIILY